MAMLIEPTNTIYSQTIKKELALLRKGANADEERLAALFGRPWPPPSAGGSHSQAGSCAGASADGMLRASSEPSLKGSVSGGSSQRRLVSCAGSSRSSRKSTPGVSQGSLDRRHVRNLMLQEIQELDTRIAALEHSGSLRGTHSLRVGGRSRR
mmetsp:Transcript_105456/g.183423  ORF Transcript_105456/g.183423 Transcript_105456/m.183423 type:complete len:153 (-) Transcript_105456:85-543(-)